MLLISVGLGTQATLLMRSFDTMEKKCLSGGLIRVVVREGLTTELSNAGGQSWRSLRWESLKKFVPYIIIDEIQSLGLNVAHGHTLKAAIDLSKQLSQVMRNLVIDYGGQFGCHMPDVDIVIYHPDTCKVLAVISGQVTSNRIDSNYQTFARRGNKTY